MTALEPLRVLSWGVPDDLPRFGPTTPYAEGVWLPVLGPTSFLLWRQLSRCLTVHPAGVTVHPASLAAGLGVGAGAGNQSPVARSLRRLHRFGVVRLVHDGLVLAHRGLPPVLPYQLDRLHPGVRAIHDRCLDREPAAASGPARRSAVTGGARRTTGAALSSVPSLVSR